MVYYFLSLYTFMKKNLNRGNRVYDTTLYKLERNYNYNNKYENNITADVFRFELKKLRLIMGIFYEFKLNSRRRDFNQRICKFLAMSRGPSQN